MKYKKWIPKLFYLIILLFISCAETMNYEIMPQKEIYKSTNTNLQPINLIIENGLEGKIEIWQKDKVANGRDVLFLYNNEKISLRRILEIKLEQYLNNKGYTVVSQNVSKKLYIKIQQFSLEWRMTDSTPFRYSLKTNVQFIISMNDKEKVMSFEYNNFNKYFNTIGTFSNIYWSSIFTAGATLNALYTLAIASQWFITVPLFSDGWGGQVVSKTLDRIFEDFIIFLDKDVFVGEKL